MKPATLAPRDGLDPQDPDPHQRLGVPELPDHEADEQRDRYREEGDRASRDPAVPARLGDGVDEQGEPARHQHGAGCVERLDARVTALLQQDRREDEARHADRDVDEEDPGPAEHGREHAAEQDARRGAEAADRAPHAERDVPLAALGEGHRQDRERRRRDHRRAEALNGARRDQRRLGPRQAGEERGEREHDEPGEKDPPAPEQVGRAAAEEQEAPEHERVGADDPLQVLLREPEVDLDRGQCHVHDCDVQDDHELHDAEKRQRPPFASI